MVSEQLFNPDRLSIGRDLRGVTQTSLAELTGIDQGTISKYENGIMIPCHEHVKLMANALGFPPEFMYRPGKREPLPAWYLVCKR